MKIRTFNRIVAMGMFILAVVNFNNDKSILFLITGWVMYNNADLDEINEILKEKLK